MNVTRWIWRQTLQCNSSHPILGLGSRRSLEPAESLGPVRGETDTVRTSGHRIVPWWNSPLQGPTSDGRGQVVRNIQGRQCYFKEFGEYCQLYEVRGPGVRAICIQDIQELRQLYAEVAPTIPIMDPKLGEKVLEEMRMAKGCTRHHRRNNGNMSFGDRRSITVLANASRTITCCHVHIAPKVTLRAIGNSSSSNSSSSLFVMMCRPAQGNLCRILCHLLTKGSTSKSIFE